MHPCKIMYKKRIIGTLFKILIASFLALYYTRMNIFQNIVIRGGELWLAGKKMKNEDQGRNNEKEIKNGKEKRRKSETHKKAKNAGF